MASSHSPGDHRHCNRKCLLAPVPCRFRRRSPLVLGHPGPWRLVAATRLGVRNCLDPRHRRLLRYLAPLQYPCRPRHQRRGLADTALATLASPDVVRQLTLAREAHTHSFDWPPNNSTEPFQGASRPTLARAERAKWNDQARQDLQPYPTAVRALP